MVDKSIDRENDVMVAQLFCFSHFPWPILFTERPVKPLTCGSWLYLSFKRHFSGCFEYSMENCCQSVGNERETLFSHFSRFFLVTY